MPNEDWPIQEHLSFAAQTGDLEQVKQLVGQGVNLNAFDELGKTPLHYAVEGDHFEIASFLIEQGADVNAHHEPTVGNTPLADDAGQCSLRMARLLVDAGADPLIRGWMQLNALDRSRTRTRGDGPRVHALLVNAALRGTDS